MDIDTYWHKISQILDSDGKICYPLLTKLAKVVLIIPHGNADVERIFSHMGLNKTRVCNSLGDDTLTSLLRMQFNVKESCYGFKPTSRMLEKCKMLYLHWLPLPQTNFICFLLCTCMSNCLCTCASFVHYFSCQDFVGILWKPNVRTLGCYARIIAK